MVPPSAVVPSAVSSSDQTPHQPADRVLSVSTIPASVTSLRASCVTIRDSAGGAGSGVVIAPGVVATCAHVVDGSPVVAVQAADGAIVAGQVVRLAGARHLDTALVVCPELQAPPAPIASETPAQDAPVYAIGTPAGMPELAGAVKAGSVHSVGDDGQLWLDIQVIPGNSGGPLVNEAGEVIGLVAGTVAGAYGAAVPISVALRLLSEYRSGVAPVSVGPEFVVRRAEWLRAQGITQPAPVAGGVQHMEQTTQAAGQAAARPVALSPEDKAEIGAIVKAAVAEALAGMMETPEPEMSEQPPAPAPQAFPTSVEDASDALVAAGATPELAALLAPSLVNKMPTDKPVRFKALGEEARKVMEAVKASAPKPEPVKAEAKEPAKPEPQKVAATTPPAKLEPGKAAVPSYIRARAFTSPGK